MLIPTGVAFYQNITIENCTFGTASGYRSSGSAHILFEQIGDGATIFNVNVNNNNFTEILTQLCIAFTNILGAQVSITNPGTLLNSVTIKGTANRAVMALASYFKARGMKQDEAEQFVGGFVNDIPNNMVSRKTNGYKTTVKSIYSGDKYSFSCGYIKNLVSVNCKDCKIRKLENAIRT